MIVAMHVAAGAAAGALTGSRGGAVVAGLVLHALQDAVPHEDIPSHELETASGVFLLIALALRRGPLDPAVLGGAACAAPDLEHVLPLPRPEGASSTPPTAWKAGTGKGACPPGRSCSPPALSSPH